MLRWSGIGVAASLLWAVGWSGVSPVAAAAAAPGRGQSGVAAEVEVERQETALECPDSSALTARIETILQRPVTRGGSPGVAVRIGVRFRHEADGYVAEMEFRGSKAGVRVLRDRSPDCEPLADAVGVAIALVLDRQLEQGESASPSGGSTSAGPGSKPIRAAPPQERDRPNHDKPKMDRGPVLRVAAGGGFATGFADSVSPLLVAEFALELEPWALTAAGGTVMASRAAFRSGKVETSLAMGSVGACRLLLREPVWLAPCGFAGVGRLRGHGVGYDEDRTHDMLWTALGAGVVAERRIWGPLLVGVTATLWVPPRRQRYAVENAGVAWQSPAVSPWFTGHVGLVIW